MKHKKKGKKLLLAAIALALVAGIGGGIWFLSVHNTEPVNVFSFQHIGMTEYWGDSQESYGPVTTDKIQTVFLSDTQTVTEIKVAAGDTVKKGDILMSFDTTLSDLALERKRLDVEKMKLQLQTAERELQEIRGMKPMVVIQQEEDKKEEDKGTELTDDYQISKRRAYDGSAKSMPIVCWIRSGVAIDDTLLEKIRQRAENLQEANGKLMDEDGTVTPVTSYYVIFKVTAGDMSLGARKTWQGMRVFGDASAGFYFKFFDASGIADYTLVQEDDSDIVMPEIDYGSGYTAAELANMRVEKEKEIKELKFDVKMVEAEYKIMQAELSDGNIYAQIDGKIVSLLTEEEARQNEQPILKLSGGGGFYVEGSISELEKDAMEIGQEVTINDWNTGASYPGKVTSIGDFPTLEDSWNGMGNPNASFYPFKAFVEESANLQEGNYVSIMYSAGASQHGIYLQNPFVRSEMGRSYVYVRGADGRLEKRYVTVGKSLWGSYKEILSGITAEDFLAFPYGKNVKEGAQTLESDPSALYGY